MSISTISDVEIIVLPSSQKQKYQRNFCRSNDRINRTLGKQLIQND